jgi:carbonic anhydrase/acetyltransferase-like protein (isoleucine patch superfamily)
MRRVLLTGAATCSLVLGALAPHAVAQGGGGGCSPTYAGRPVCPGGAPERVASFLDPTASVVGPQHIRLGQQVYIGPFARLVASAQAPITIGHSSNVQDNVSIVAARGAATAAGGAAGVQIGQRVILAHGSSVLGPARIGIHRSELPDGVDVETGEGSVFMSFGSRVDGGVLEIDSGVSALGRVGPGVRLRSGYLVLPGKNVTTQRQADDPRLGKVRYLNQADVEFNEAVIHVNESLAREYTDLYRDRRSAIRGVGRDPGGSDFNPDRDLPSFAGVERAVPTFRNRVIGDVDLADTFARFDSVTGRAISLRADEGEPFVVGRVAAMGDDVIFHALEHADLHVGNGVRYGAGAIVHGGGRVIVEGQPEEQTVIRDRVTLGPESVVFRSTVGSDSTIGRRSAVVGSELAPGTTIPPRTIYLNDAVFGPVEW